MNTQKRKHSNGNPDEKKGTKLLRESRDLLTEILSPRTQWSTYVSPDEVTELRDFGEVLFQSRKNSPSVFPEQTPPIESTKEYVQQPRNLTNAVIHFIRERKKILAFLISLSIGCIIGLLLRIRKEKYSDLEIFIIKFPGLFYVRTIQGMLMPLIAASTVSSLARLNFKLGFELFWRFSLYAVVTKVIVITLAMALSLILEPGSEVVVTKEPHEVVVTSNVMIVLTDMFRNIIPDKLFPIFFEKASTTVLYTGQPLPDDVTLQQTLLSNPDNWTYFQRTLALPNYIGLIVCSWGIGFALQRINHTNRLILRLTTSVENILLQIGDWYLRFATIGKFSLLIAAIVSYDVSSGPHNLLTYGATMFATMFFYVFIITPLYFYLMTFINPWPYFKHMLPVLFTAFTTSSSVVTLPSTLSYLEEDASIGNVPCRLLGPFGAVVNMDGTAIYLTISSIFVAQALKRELTFWNLCTIWITSFLESINISPVPEDARMTGLTTAFLTLGISVYDYEGVIKKLQAIDEITDRFRTVVNVYGDIVTALIVNFVMTRLAEQRGGVVSIGAFLDKQKEKRRISRMQLQATILASNKKVIEESEIKNDDLELVSVSSTTSEDKINYPVITNPTYKRE